MQLWRVVTYLGTRSFLLVEIPNVPDPANSRMSDALHLFPFQRLPARAELMRNLYLSQIDTLDTRNRVGPYAHLGDIWPRCSLPQPLRT